MKNKLKLACYVLSLLLLTPYAMASNDSLQSQRLAVIQDYVYQLGTGNYNKIIPLFSPDAIAVSSSGKADNVKHFYTTLLTKTISEPQSHFINTFTGTVNKDVYAAYFTYSWNNKDNTRVSSYFLDLIYFKPGSSHIKKLMVFSNTFQDDIMKMKQSQQTH